MVVYEVDIVDNEMPYYLGQPHRLAFVEAFCFRRVCMLGIGGLMVFMDANCARRGRISFAVESNNNFGQENKIIITL